MPSQVSEFANPSELESFLEFAKRLKAADTSLSLDDVMRRFREMRREPARTALVETLDRLRGRYIAEGGKLLSADEVEEEVRKRRGSFGEDSP